MSTTRDDLHARIDQLSDAEVEQLATVLDALEPAEPLPPGATLDDITSVLRAYAVRQQRRAPSAANDTTGTPLALEALGDYVGARPGLVSDLLDHPPDPKTDPVGAALVDDHQRQVAGYGKRQWRGLTPEQKAAAAAAGAEHWR
jgi:hypothetical protein